MLPSTEPLGRGDLAFSIIAAQLERGVLCYGEEPQKRSCSLPLQSRDLALEFELEGVVGV